MARRTKRLWTDEEKRSICLQTAVTGVSVAQVARRYALNANLIFTWLRDPRFAPTEEADAGAAGEPHFLPVEIIDGEALDDGTAANEVEEASGRIEIDLASGCRIRVIGAYDAEALALLVRRLSA